MTPRTAVLYARVSSREQREEGYSIEAQEKLLRKFAVNSGFEIVREFIDVESAKSTGRKEFGKMLEFLERSKTCRTILVEKTDRLSRNFEDEVALNQLDLEIHFVKTGTVLSKDARAQTKFMHGIELVSSKYYSDNLREEVIKGMREKAEQGTYPGRAPFGYRNNTATRTIEIHRENADVARRVFELYASGRFSLLSLSKELRYVWGTCISKTNLHKMLTNPFYLGNFEWSGQTYRGKHPSLINPDLYAQAQAVLNGHNRPKYGKHHMAFRGMLTCAHDNCAVTAELKKNKYVYYRCTGHRGKCALPRFREQEIAERMGRVLKDVQIPAEIVQCIGSGLQRVHGQMRDQAARERSGLEHELKKLYGRMDSTYRDKSDRKITEEFWQRMQADLQTEELRIKSLISQQGEANCGERLLNIQRILELAQAAYSLYLTRKPAEQAELLRNVLLNCSIDAVSLYPTYRKPFDLIFNRVKNHEWSGREDLNLRPPGPELGKSKL